MIAERDSGGMASGGDGHFLGLGQVTQLSENKSWRPGRQGKMQHS